MEVCERHACTPCTAEEALTLLERVHAHQPGVYASFVRAHPKGDKGDAGIGQKRKRSDEGADGLIASEIPARCGKRRASRGDRKFDFSRFRFRHVALHLMYLGKAYHGFAAQLSSKASRTVGADGGDAEAQHALTTVESALFAALTRACLIEDRGSCGYTRCGRTDAGVSAAGQIVALRVRSKARLVPGAGVAGAAGEPLVRHAASSVGQDTGEAGDDAECPRTVAWRRRDGLDNAAGDPFPAADGDEVDYVFILNHLLPDDIRVVGWAEVPDHAHNVIAGHRATLPQAPVEGTSAAAALPLPPPPPPLTPFSARFSASARTYRYFFINRGYDFAGMAAAGARMAGRHDFRNFAKVDVANAQNFVRVVYSVRPVVAGSPEDVAGAFVTPSALFRTPQLPPQQPTAAASACADGGVTAAATVVPVGTVCFFEVVGQAFLWHQVRCMAAVLLHVGAGLEGPEVVDFLLDVGGGGAPAAGDASGPVRAGSCPSRPQYDLAPEQPLCLHHCSFGEEGEERGEGEGVPEPETAAAASVSPALHAAAAAAAAADAGSVAGASKPPPGTGRPLVVAHSCPGLYRALTCSSAGAAAAAAALYARWEALTLEAAVVASMLQRATAAAVAAGAEPFVPDPRERLVKAKRYVRLADRPREPTVADKWRALGTEGRARVSAQHPHNAARLVSQLEAQAAALASPEAGPQ